MLNRIARMVRQHDWSIVGIEILIVMIGLLLAFQLDRWREGFAERKQEQTYINRLIANIEKDVPAIEYGIELQSIRLALTDLLIAVAADADVATEKPVVFLGAINQAAYTYTPKLTSHTFENLLSTGDLRLIRDESVKSIMFDYYGFDESQWQYRPLQLDTEFRHFVLSAGVLSQEQALWMQDQLLYFTPDNFKDASSMKVSSEEVLAAAQRFQQRPELIAWLPQVRGMQLDQISVHKQRLDRARAALIALNDYAGEIR